MENLDEEGSFVCEVTLKADQPQPLARVTNEHLGKSISFEYPSLIIKCWAVI